MTVETEELIAPETDTADLVPSENAAAPMVEPTGASSFPKVLRRRLDRFFAEQNVSPKANPMMWGKIVLGLAVLAGSWTALYVFRPGSGMFVALYLLGGLAQTFLFLTFARQQDLELRLRSVRDQLVYVAHPASSGPSLLRQSAW
jgi:linoleoyl-CoA desaturase